MYLYENHYNLKTRLEEIVDKYLLKNSTVFLRESIKNVRKKTIREKHESKQKAAAAKKGIK